MDIEEIAAIIVDSAVHIHRTFGPGLLESAYQKCLAHELKKRGLEVQCELIQPIVYDDELVDSGYRIDMLVNDCIIIENKTVDEILPVHHAQILTYMRLRHIKIGFILNWKVELMKHGIRRMKL